MDFLIPFNVYLQKHRFKRAALYHALRDAIVGGALPYGTKLPSSRELARLYVVSRGTVNQAYEMLLAEGYVTASVGRGTHVSFQRRPGGAPGDNRTDMRLSAWGERVNGFPLREAKHAAKIEFTLGMPDKAAFPVHEWNRRMRAEVRQMVDRQLSDAFMAQGHLPLREAISLYLRRSRGMDAAPEQIVVVNGSMQAIALLTQLLVNPGEPVVAENPGYAGTRRAIEAAGGVVLAADVDACGMKVEDWPSRLLFVTPGKQFPTGAVLSLERRRQLLEWAARRGAVIVEDDYDSEFRWGGRPIEPLKALDTEDRVVYIGTFSKTMLTDLRIGYVVLPAGLTAPFVKAKQLYEPHPTGIMEQRALAAFMNAGRYERHLRKMKRVYSKKYETLLHLLQEKLSDYFRVAESEAGLHIYAEWKHSEEAYLRYKAACLEAGVRWQDAGACFADRPRPAACFGFSHLTEREMRDGVGLMARIGKDALSGTS